MKVLCHLLNPSEDGRYSVSVWGICSMTLLLPAGLRICYFSWQILDYLRGTYLLTQQFDLIWFACWRTAVFYLVCTFFTYVIWNVVRFHTLIFFYLLVNYSVFYYSCISPIHAQFFSCQTFRIDDWLFMRFEDFELSSYGCSKLNTKIESTLLYDIFHPCIMYSYLSRKILQELN